MANCLQQLQQEEEIFPNRVFLGGLDRKFTELQLESFFSELGQVVDVRIVCDRKTGLSKGYGFVTFEDTGVCNKLINEGSIEYMGKILRVRTAVRRKGQGQFQDEKPKNSKLSQSQVINTANVYYSYQWPSTEYVPCQYAVYQNLMYVPSIYFQPWQ